MNKNLAIFKSDIKSTRRDPTLLMMLFSPVLIILLLRYGLPALTPFIPALPEYHLAVTVFMGLLGAILPGIVVAFLLLDEKEAGLFTAIRVTPVSISGMLASRMMSLIVLSFISSVAILSMAGLYTFSWIRMLQLALLSGGNVPVFIMLIAFFAHNKIEGMAMLKVTMLVVMIPVLMLFINDKWIYLFSFFPSFWVFAFARAELPSNLIFLLGFLYLVLLNTGVFYFAGKKAVWQ